jgi:polyisoprenoid-binding protein YceI
MKILLSIFTIISLSTGIHAEQFIIDTGHAEIGFSVKHMMVSNTKGNFNTFEGTVDFDIASNTLKSMKGTIEVASIDTNNEKRDEHLRDKDFFNTSEYPTITFQSSEVTKKSDNTYTVKGQLNVLGVDNEVSLPLTVNGPIDDPRGLKRIGIECETVLNRRELGITKSPASMIGDEVKVSLQLEATYK